MNALTLPDIAAQTALEQQPLDWVGMCGDLLLERPALAPACCPAGRPTPSKQPHAWIHGGFTWNCGCSWNWASG